MIVLNFEVIKQTVSQKNFEKLVNDSSNYVKLCFDFIDKNWSDVYKRVLFHSRSTETYCEELDENHEVIVPWEVLTEDYFVFNLYGVGEDSLRITTSPQKVSLKESGYSDEIEKPLPPTPSVLDDIYNKINEADSSIDALDVTVSGHTETLTNLTQRVNGLTGDVSVISESVDALESTVNEHSASIESNATNISNLNDLVNDFETVLNRHDDRIHDVETKLNRTIEMTVEYPDGTSESFDVVVK